MSSIRILTRWVVAGLLTLTLGWGAVQQSVHHHTARYPVAGPANSTGALTCHHHHDEGQAAAREPDSHCFRELTCGSATSTAGSSHDCPSDHRRDGASCAICRFLTHQLWHAAQGVEISAVRLVWTEPVADPALVLAASPSAYLSRAPPLQDVSQA